MTINTILSLELIIKSQIEELRNLWYASCSNQFSITTDYPIEVKLANEGKLSATLEWLDQQLESATANPSMKELVSREAGERAKALGCEILNLSDEEVNCFHGLGIDRSLERFYYKARAFDPQMSESDIYQASRNVWTGNYMQVLLNRPVELTPSLFAYSMLYPISDNYLDNPRLSRCEKIEFNKRFRYWLMGEKSEPANPHEAKIHNLVRMIEDQYPRGTYPQVFDSLLAIHSAQDKSMRFPKAPVVPNSVDVLGMTIEKGGTSVLADGFLAAGELSEQEIRLIFNYGAFAQLMDDQEDLEKDLKEQSVTLFTEAARQGKVDQILNQMQGFASQVLEGLDYFNNEQVLSLKKASIKGIHLLLIDAALRTERYYSRQYISALEKGFPLRFKYLKKVREKIKNKAFTLERILGLFGDKKEVDVSIDAKRLFSY